ncbi:hypothetical protein LJR098_002571 [Rhizobium sp. LjRoot98]|uniref:hypothetical protein n=1 Tax=unclassified Rhizobium TaxID=2613769 RepID=UPI000713D5D4|nr:MULTISPECIES: hypothetical protein [unclassified Rhizobium]KQV31255.1 hypothetical protein ASC96_08715 [Rhizobium sp. Root1204]KQY10794.1 hypothetical protein ASD36_08745 [Rhizobium sp. Root1334]KRC04779.1 hypothetical protein ASE23_06510 [Rhizobium sp. Root73]
MKSRSEIIELPERHEVLSKLTDLINGACSPAEASDWANRWVLADHDPIVDVRIDDRAVWDALMQMSGADLYGGDREFLHDHVDYQAWLDQLRNGFA